MSEEVTRFGVDAWPGSRGDEVSPPPAPGSTHPFARHVAIIGAGFSGALLAINLLRHDGPKVTLIERREVFGKGVAYSTAEDHHLLNVRAGNMSALPDEPDHFVEWLERQGGAPRQGFASRNEYGRYLNELLEETVAASAGQLLLKRASAASIEWRDSGGDVVLDDGERISADTVVLALGNLPPHDPAGLADGHIPADIYTTDPWAADFTRDLASDDTVLILGTGLTMVDAVLTLEGAGYGGKIVAMSRRGLLPRAHASVPATYHPLVEKPAERGSALVRRVRQDANQIGWRGAIDALRPFSQALWLGATEVERKRFLRHLRAWWDVHRHRLAPQVAAQVEGLRANGRLRIVGGKLADVRVEEGGQALARYRPRHADGLERLKVRRIINCTGPQGNLLRSAEPLLQNLLQTGDICADRNSLGVDVNARSEVLDRDGTANPRLLAVGPLTRGAFWEIAAVPDIRVQVWSLARRLTASHWVEGEGL